MAFVETNSDSIALFDSHRDGSMLFNVRVEDEFVVYEFVRRGSVARLSWAWRRLINRLYGIGP